MPRKGKPEPTWINVPFQIILYPTLGTNGTCPCLVPLAEAQGAAMTEAPVDLSPSTYEGRMPGAELLRFAAHTLQTPKHLLSLRLCLGLGRHAYFPY